MKGFLKWWIVPVTLMIIVGGVVMSPSGQAREIRDGRFLSLREALDISLKRNTSLKLINIKIKKAKLDIEQQFIDVSKTRLMVKRKKLALLSWKNQQKTIIQNVSLDVHNKYYQCVIAGIRLNIAKEDLLYAEELLKESRQNFKDGKIHKIQLRQMEEMYKQKEEEKIMSRGELKRAKLALLLSINERLGARIRVGDNVGENIRELKLKGLKKEPTLQSINEITSILDKLSKTSNLHAKKLNRLKSWVQRQDKLISTAQ